MNIPTVIMESPRLRIQSGEDGVWLHFSTANGEHAGINLSNMNRGDIIGNNIRAWAKEYATLNPPQNYDT